MPAQLPLKESGTASKRYVYRPELDVLRFVAFSGVFLFHTVDYPLDFYLQHHVPRILAEVSRAAIASGKYGVDLFFALSSYLITDLLIREKEQFGSLNVRSFYIRRILRIWPLYYFILIITLFIPFFDPDHQFGLKYFLPFIFLSGNWAFAAFGGPARVPASPLWSVSIEEQFYLFWPPVVARLSRQKIIYAALGMIIVANVARLMLHVTSATAMALWANTFAHLDSIAVGILLAATLHGRASSIQPSARIALLMFAAACMTLRGYFQIVIGESVSWGNILIAWPIVVVACAVTLFAFIGLKVHKSWLPYLGKVSYGLYAYHMFCIMLVDRLLAIQHRLPEHSFLRAALRECLSLGLTIAVAAISYAFLETPFLRLKERFTRVRSRPV
jgi:peptidoglycan/LPS O-acetylase OafA/YrhL